MTGGILGLDLAMKYGWAYVGPDGAYVSSGRRELSITAGIGERAHCLSLSIADLVTEFAPEHIAIEAPIHFGARTSFLTARSLYAYAAVAAWVAHVREIGFAELARSTCCKHVLGDGRAKKEAGVAFVRALHPSLAKLDSDDQADAILVALAAHRLRMACRASAGDRAA